MTTLPDTVTLTPADVEAVACRVVELLRAERVPAARFVDAAELAELLGVERPTIYAHADELGGVRVGTGKRPRLRFDADRALATWTAQPPGGPQAVEPARRGRRRSAASPAELLPIRGRRAA